MNLRTSVLSTIDPRRLGLFLLAGLFLLPDLFFAEGRLFGQSLDTEGKISSRILYHQRMKTRADDVSPSEHLQKLEKLRIPRKDLGSESTALYVSERLTASELRSFRSKGIRIEASSWVPPVSGQHPYGFYLAQVDYSALSVVAKEQKVVRVASLGGVLRPHNDLANAMTEVPRLHSGLSGTARRGAGVKIAIADSGLDLSHPDIPTPVEAYDVSDGTGIAEWSTDVTDHVSGHGTHVVGTAVGSGEASGGRYMGVAPDADLYFYKIGNDDDAFTTEEDIIEAVLRASEVGCDIFSMSYGGPIGPLDGSDAIDQAIDVATRRGMLCFISAGNEASSSGHHSIEVAPGESGFVDFQIDNSQGNGHYSANENFTVRWRDGAPGDGNIQLVADSLGQGESLAEQYSESSHRGTEMRGYRLRVSVPAGSFRSYRLRLVNSASEGETPRVHSVLVFGGGRGRFSRPDPRSTVGSPATADSAIAVGAWTQRCCWTNWRGESWSYGRLEGRIDQLAFFSSQGPRIDGRQKPEICAPGAATISCRDSSPAIAENMNKGHFVDNDGLNLNGD
ncbi:MAG: S8 family serine peptidase, partial [Planctomycetota bacterium]